MTIKKLRPDISKAKSLLTNAQSFIVSIKPIRKTAKSAFLIIIDYDILHSLSTSIMAFDGEKVAGKDHHKELIERISDKYKLTIPQKQLFDELRRMRNDINYYGQKKKDIIDDFYQRNSNSIEIIRNKLLGIIKSKLST